jgi:hypothetical protein
MKLWPLLICALVPGCYGDPAEWEREKFSTGSWNQAESFDRKELARDLVDSGILIGKARAEVIALLGEPDSSRNSTDRMSAEPASQ